MPLPDAFLRFASSAASYLRWWYQIRRGSGAQYRIHPKE